MKDVLVEINKPPKFLITKQKSDYNNEGEIQKLMQEIQSELAIRNTVSVNEFLAEIIDISDNQVVLNCLMDKDTPYYQIRKFDKAPLMHFEKFETGRTLIVKTTTSMGQRLFEFIEQFEDNSKLFEQKNIFLKLKDSPLLNPKQL